MLFVDDGVRGQGIGKQLLRYAVDVLGARFVDVNEQNTQGVGFYRHMGFSTIRRSEHDDQGRPFPLLHLELTSKQRNAVILKTARLLLRPWTEADAESLYEYAKNPLVGPAAGWPVQNNSRQIIRDILSAKETYAVTRKGNDAAIGSVGLLRGDKSNLRIADDEAEVGYWIGEPHWGKGYIPEAVRELMRHAFEDLKLSALWCGYFDGNEKSKRVAEKCGFTFHHTEHDKEWPLIGAVKTQHITRITKDEWSATL